MLEDVLTAWGAVEVSAMDVYSDVFHLRSGMIQSCGDESRDLKSNPLGYWRQENSDVGHYRIMFEDTFEDTLRELQEADLAIMNGLTYFGRRNTQSAANRMFAMIFDLDGVTDRGLNNLLHSAINGAAMKIYPIPNYIALSGHGVHLYYVFRDPVPLYPNIKLQLKEFKYALTRKIWNRYTAGDLGDKPQYQGINQGFRVIGGKTKIPGVRVRAFRVNSVPVTLQQLGEFIPVEFRVDERKIWTESKMTLTQARKKYPEWYSAVVEHGERRDGHWICKPDLYHWWLRRIREGALLGHRYFCVMVLAIYAIKSGVSLENLKRDAEDLIPFMNDIAPGNEFNHADVDSALECYELRYIRFPIDDIVKLTQIPIEKNKRNGRKQSVHLRIARSTLEIMNDERGEALQGRPSKASAVTAWRADHPDGRKVDCIKDTGISKTTVYKHWEEKEPGDD